MEINGGFAMLFLIWFILVVFALLIFYGGGRNRG